jgi:hypothetical protein
MTPIRPPYPPEGIAQQGRDQEVYRRVDGRLQSANAAPRGFALGSAVSHNAQAGNLDAVYVTLSFPTSTAATQVAVITHQLGRTVAGFELVQANAPIHIYSNTATTVVERRTNAHFGAMVYGSAVTATLRIF